MTICKTFGITLLLWMSASSYAAGIVNMRCEYMSAPLGVDTSSPRLSWEYSNPEYSPALCHVELSSDSLFTSPLSRNVSDGSMVRIKIPEESGKTWYWRVVTQDKKGKKVISSCASFETGKMNQTDWKAEWITDSHDISYEPAPVLTYKFISPRVDKKARAYVSAVGYYDMEINGERVGKNHMDPGFTHYDRRNLYAVHDVTGMLHEGENSIKVTLGNGFANMQSRDSWGQEKAPWRTRPLFLCEIIVDGKTVAMTGKDWTAWDGPVTYNNLYSGVHHDGRLSLSNPAPVKIAEAPSRNLKSQMMHPILPADTIIPIMLTNIGDSIFVFDMGKNIAGVCRLNVKGEKGTVLSMAHGELLKSNGLLEQGNLDIYYHPLKDGERFQTDCYTLSGSSEGESFVPPFTYHGFRYVEIRTDRPIKRQNLNVEGIMAHTALPRIGHFRCSNDLLNKIYDATMLSYVDNLHSIPTDCPQREKNGWTADAHVAIDLALMNYDGITLYEKWMDDFIDNQLPNGNIAGVIPSAGWGYGDSPGPVWDAGLFIIPLALYDYYGDDTALRKMWPAMQKYMEWLASLKKEDGSLSCGIGDWLPYNTQTPTDFTSTLYAYADYKMMARIARILGEDPAPYTTLQNEMESVINTKYYDPAKGLYANGSQAAQAISLYWEVVPETERTRVAASLDRLVRENGYSLDFGLLGSKSVLRMLTKYSYLDTAWRLASGTESPSWGNWIKNLGYSTLPETWTLSPEFRDASLNHVFFGDIAAWMESDIAGLNFDPEAPGFSHVIIKPNFFKDLDWAETSFHSAKGLINLRWERETDGILLSVEIPSGAYATVCTGERELNLPSGFHKIKL